MHTYSATGTYPALQTTLLKEKHDAKSSTKIKFAGSKPKKTLATSSGKKH